MSCEVSTVHGRDIPGIQRAKVASVVPVVEVPSNQFKLAHCVEYGFQSVNGVERAEITKVVRRQC